jgi:acyl-[acyl carrier protein]--UDP-N-acetylglucosamine O-acyltransferase
MGLNTIGLKRAGLTSQNLAALKRVTKLFYNAKQPLEHIQETATTESWGQDEYVQTFINFAKASTRGISRSNLLDT